MRLNRNFYRPELSVGDDEPREVPREMACDDRSSPSANFISESLTHARQSDVAFRNLHKYVEHDRRNTRRWRSARLGAGRDGHVPLDAGPAFHHA